MAVITTPQLGPRELAERIDSALLRPEATGPEVARWCAEAVQWGFGSVCVQGSRVVQAMDLLARSSVSVATVVGFPFGASDGDTKRFETEVAVDNGAQEIAVVINPGRLKDRDFGSVQRELRDVVEAADERWVAVILETGLLTREEIICACGLVRESGAQGITTSTGFGPRGATVEDVRLLRETVGPAFSVGAAGGICTAAVALALMAAGATRLGTSSGAAILQELGATVEELPQG